MRTGRSQGFEFHNPTTGLWHEIRINRVDETRMAQLFFDISARKQAEEHQARLFDELNHRVKNNLTIVSGLLQMQARSGPREAREQLMKGLLIAPCSPRGPVSAGHS